MMKERLSLVLLTAMLASCPGSTPGGDGGTCLTSTPMNQLHEGPCPMGSSYMRCYTTEPPGFF